MKLNTSMRRRSAAVSSVLENLEGRRLFAVAYTITDLAPDIGGIVHTGKAYGISDNGRVAMRYDGNAAVWKDGVVTDLGFAGYATDVNNSGVVCGVDSSTGQSRPFVWKDGVKTILSLEGNTNGIASAINNSGTVVGTFYNLGIANDGFRAPLGGSAIDVGNPAGYQSVNVTGINNDGQIIGNVYDSSTGFRAFIKSGTTFKLLGPLPGGPSTYTGHGIKNNGDIAIWGPSADLYSDGTTKIYHAYVVGSNGYGAITDRGTYDSFYDIDASDINAANVITGNNNPGLNDEQGMVNRGSGFDLVQSLIDPAAGWTRIFSAEAVNDSGRIVGEGFNALDQRSPYLLTPVAPATYTISGKLWNDSDADGIFDAGESTSGVRTVYIDANGNNKLDNGEKQTQSNANGEYAFGGLANGTYKITRVFPAGYGLSNGPGYLETVVNGVNRVAINLGSAAKAAPPSGSISGVLWNDADRDGVFDNNEARSGVRTVFIDADGDKTLEAGERSVQSNAQGVYTFNGLAAGTYKVTRVFPAGYRLSNNASGFVTINLALGQAKTGVNLGTRTV